MPVICMSSFWGLGGGIFGLMGRESCAACEITAPFSFFGGKSARYIFYRIFIIFKRICLLAQIPICKTCLACSNDYIINKENTTNRVNFALFAHTDSLVKFLERIYSFHIHEIFLVHIPPST